MKRIRLAAGVPNLLASVALMALSGLAAVIARDATTEPEIVGRAPLASAMTVDMRDLDLDLSLPVEARITRTITPLPSGQTAPLAPLMEGWDNAFVYAGREQSWCLDGVRESVARVVRLQLNILADAYPPPTEGKPGIAWREACPGSYLATETAETDCRPDAVACAVWYGEQSGKLSVNGQLLRAGRLDRALNVAIAHELGHLQGSLDHNGCGKVIDPLSRRAVPSAMTPVDLGTGASCSDPPAFGYTADDWGNAIVRYRLTPAGLVRATPTPPPVTEPPGLPAPAHPVRATQPGQTRPVFTTYDLSVVGTIADEADRLGLPPLWVLSVGAQEGGLACVEGRPATCPTGDLDLDSRGSCGVFQIYVAVHGQTCSYWHNPVNAMRQMIDRWRWAYDLAGGGNAFLNDPHTFLQASVPRAQGSIAWTPDIASGAFRVALISYIDLLQSRAVARGDGDSAGALAALRIAAEGLDDIALRVAVQAEQLRRTADGR